ncbi:MAG: aminotransferase class I/II-fold pyridoxal phosphate-dependent enzyme [Rhodospirillaceae bacterium]|jgi:aspartate/methionine/tyrosine aminotransferase|nr:aminotransferase class I/II-fold pyridoxal phosphate-dependent enzyme [Rhodospirillaceae bacterium]MBT5658972.1 aminotransferase class I/II-fold pyridoxal phosphate-dependent enzyme [Rhodospirillaceae bacterium]MBT5752671.1 aminotransferase class I/II-fold pyridoxal phosphate-dependent enzyme [Rhodospirillaceae bacterium]
MPLKASRRGDISSFLVMDMLRAANERAVSGEDVFHLELGEPSARVPSKVLEAARNIIGTGMPGYTESLGLPALRERISAYYRERENIAVPAQRIAITTGSSGAFILAFLAAFDVGDRVVLAAPGYPAYRNILTALGVEPVLLSVGAKTRFQPTVELLDSLAQPVDGLIIASPSNPAGTIIDEESLAELCAYCAQKGIRLISDEIYHGITFGPKAISALAFPTQGIVINSFSKYFAMPGWRLGWMVVPEDLLGSVERLAQNLFISAPGLSQHAAIAVFDCLEELDVNVATYARNREILLEGLPKAGFTKLAPADGAFYLYADVSHLTDDSQSFCTRMLAETGVAATSGIDFDPQLGGRFVRFSYAGPTRSMEEAVKRLKIWLSGSGKE